MTATRYINPRTGAEWPIETPLWRAPDDGGYVNLTRTNGFRQDAIDQSVSSLWRYRDMLRFEGAPLTLGEGWTPLLDGAWNGRPVAFKCDHLMPSGSFKDRGVAVMMAYLRAVGVDAVLEDSSGNAGASVATFAAASGIAATIYSPAAAPPAKLAQMAAMGADVRPIKGPRQNAADAAIAEAEGGVFYAGHNIQPYFLEGVKTLAFELWEQQRGQTPDHVVVACGQGGNVMGLDIGYRELLAAGLIDKMPAIHGVQAFNAGPYLAAWDAGSETPIPIDAKPSIADGITSSVPVRLKEVLAACRESGGSLLGVDETEIVAAMRKIHRSGFFVEPTTAAGAAGLTKLMASGRIGADETVVLVLTGTGLKAVDAIRSVTETKTSA
ncbi:MAG: threonine synthase [Alphaproteobacteria bacterium]